MEVLSGSGMAAAHFGCSSASVTSTACFLPGARLALFFPAWSRLPVRPPRIVSHTIHAKKKNSSFKAVLKQSVSREVEREDEVVMEDDEEEGDDDFIDELEDGDCLSSHCRDNLPIQDPDLRPAVAWDATGPLCCGHSFQISAKDKIVYTILMLCWELPDVFATSGQTQHTGNVEDGYMLVDEDVDFEEEFELDDMEPYVGDGAAGGGVSLAGTWWDKEALVIAEDVSKSFNGDLKIYAFKTSANSVIRVRIEKLSSKYGSPSMIDIEEFSSAYRARLDEAENAGTLPQNISLEVSSPGVERVVQIPEDLERFKDRPMYVKYSREVPETDSSQESDGVLKLITFNMESGYCIWGLADVKVNREKAGKGRPLSKKQREWRLQTPFDSLLLVRLYSEC
ncbi:hypothetical protein Taro_035554 [Colocasia esculenta]|uniref:Ribosome maturation factor RimP N-terminal domain-containing protein n=1 Tax=Colocasia esculenta TaxID=4460 RepID=A0A843W0R0_COLES|nr:hypothetical protein [Colocasia esculenta]